jgi:hypothetical protein
MVKMKSRLNFVHHFIPPKDTPSDEKVRQLATGRKAFTTFLLLYGTGGNEEELFHWHTS